MRVLLCDYVCLRVHMPAKQAHISDTTQRINQSSCFERFILDSPDESVACPMPMQYLTPLRAFLHFSQGVDLSLFSSLSLAAPPRFVVPHSTRSSESLGSVSDASESSDSVSLSARFFDLLCEALPRDDAVSRPLMSWPRCLLAGREFDGEPVSLRMSCSMLLSRSPSSLIDPETSLIWRSVLRCCSIWSFAFCSRRRICQNVAQAQFAK
jgi:hypothetical protein